MKQTLFTQVLASACFRKTVFYSELPVSHSHRKMKPFVPSMPPREQKGGVCLFDLFPENINMACGLRDEITEA